MAGPSTSFSPLPCSSCHMWSRDESLFDSWGSCVKCSVLASLEARVTELETQIRLLQTPTCSEVVTGTAVQTVSPTAQEFITVAQVGKRKRKSSNPKPRQPESSVVTQNRFQVLDEWYDSEFSYSNDPQCVAECVADSVPTRDGVHPPDSEPQWTRQTLVIGSSIVRDVELPLASTRCYPGARMGDIEGNLRLLKKSKNRYRRIIIHAGGNDTRRGQSEVLKLQVEAVCELAKSMCERVLFSGPLPDFSTSEMYSRFSAFNRWLTAWCPDNDVGFIDNWSVFEGKSGLIRGDGIHPTRAGSAVLTDNMHASLQ